MYVESKKKKRCRRTYLQNRNRFIDIENKLMVIEGEEGRDGINQEYGSNRYTLLYKKKLK